MRAACAEPCSKASRTAADRTRRRSRTKPRWPSWRRSVERAARRRLGRSLSIRQVDAGSCNGCELEIHALNNAFYDLERFGLRFVASPRHADVLMVTGPVTKQHARGAANAPTTPRRIRNGWSRSATARSTAACSPAATRSSAASRTSCRSTCTSPAARRRRGSCSPAAGAVANVKARLPGSAVADFEGQNEAPSSPAWRCSSRSEGRRRLPDRKSATTRTPMTHSVVPDREMARVSRSRRIFRSLRHPAQRRQRRAPGPDRVHQRRCRHHEPLNFTPFGRELWRPPGATAAV